MFADLCMVTLIKIEENPVEWDFYIDVLHPKGSVLEQALNILKVIPLDLHNDVIGACSPDIYEHVALVTVLYDGEILDGLPMYTIHSVIRHSYDLLYSLFVPSVKDKYIADLNDRAAVPLDNSYENKDNGETKEIKQENISEGSNGEIKESYIVLTAEDLLVKFKRRERKVSNNMKTKGFLRKELERRLSEGLPVVVTDICQSFSENYANVYITLKNIVAKNPTIKKVRPGVFQRI